jgi:hypothetical protein
MLHESIATARRGLHPARELIRLHPKASPSLPGLKITTVAIERILIIGPNLVQVLNLPVRLVIVSGSGTLAVPVFILSNRTPVELAVPHPCQPSRTHIDCPSQVSRRHRLSGQPLAITRQLAQLEKSVVITNSLSLSSFSKSSAPTLMTRRFAL